MGCFTLPAWDRGRYEEALVAIDKALIRHPDVGHHLGFRAAVLGHLERSPEAKAALDRYLTLRPDLKVRGRLPSNLRPQLCTGGSHHRRTRQGGLGAGGVIPKNNCSPALIITHL